MKKKKKIEKLKAEIARLKESIEFRDRFLWKNKLVLPGDMPPRDWDVPYEDRFCRYFDHILSPDENGKITLRGFGVANRDRSKERVVDMCGSIDRSEKSTDS